MRQLVCPYCFERFPSRALAFRCINPDPSRCPPEEDRALADYQHLGIAPKLPRIFSLEKQWFAAPKSAMCTCGVKTTKIVCPRCHNDLPSQFGQTSSHIIALIGSKESGKSHFIAVLIHELTHRVGRNFNAALMPLDDQTMKRYRDDFESHLYKKREVIPGTLSARAQINVRYPLIYRFSRKTPRSFLADRKQVTSLVFFDTAGEDLTSRDLMSTENKYLANSDGIIFLLDPLQIPDIRDRISNAGRLPNINTNPEEIISRVVILIREMQNLKPSQKIKTPLALAFSKFDEIRHLILDDDPSSPLRNGSGHQGAFDLSDFELASESMRAHIARLIGTGLDSLVDDNFENFAYFGLSALGDSPDAHGRLQRGVEPFRVEDPLLWIFHNLNVVPGRRNIR